MIELFNQFPVVFLSKDNWDIVPWIRRQIQPVPRVAISKALTNPSAYLGCKCCSNSEESLPTTLPDICIAYKLHTECGRLVNLYDWMVSFNCVLKKVPFRFSNHRCSNSVK